MTADHPPVLVTVKELRRRTGWGHGTIYRKLAAGDIEAIKDGRSLRIVWQSVVDHIATLPRATFRQPAPPD